MNHGLMTIVMCRSTKDLFKREVHNCDLDQNKMNLLSTNTGPQV